MRTILSHDMVRIDEEAHGITVYIKMKSGEWIRNEPFEPNLTGLVGAMILATDVLSGKFFPTGIVKLEGVNNQKRISHGNAETIDL